MPEPTDVEGPAVGSASLPERHEPLEKPSLLRVGISNDHLLTKPQIQNAIGRCRR